MKNVFTLYFYKFLPVLKILFNFDDAVLFRSICTDRSTRKKKGELISARMNEICIAHFLD
jgi:hypothetical protein